MNIFLKIFVFLLGLSIGSFLNVVVWRWDEKKNVFGRSKCDKCNRQLNWWENIPLLSFLFLRGKCKTCHFAIPLEYFLVELGTGIIFLLTVLSLPVVNFWLVLCYLLISAILVFIFLFDFHYQIIPDLAVVGLIVLSLFSHFIYPQESWLHYFWVALGCSLFFLVLHLITKGKGMGLGDVKFAFFIGLFLGFPKAVSAIYLAFIIGAVVGVSLILLKKKKFGQHISFGPFLILGIFISWFWWKNLFKLVIRIFT